MSMWIGLLDCNGLQIEIGMHRDDRWAGGRQYIFIPTGAVWTAANVNAVLLPQPGIDKRGRTMMIKATTWLDRHRGLDLGVDNSGRSGRSAAGMSHGTRT
jgi:hypothetical protein